MTSGIPLRKGTPAAVWVRVYCFVSASDALALLLTDTSLWKNLRHVALTGRLSAVAARLEQAGWSAGLPLRGSAAVARSGC